ncbi:MAG: DegT/DnrJ/EryC1/StrS family aminotransferase [Armatimonadetes bacterium]|nr:DegT/DnrJ/EryC1/StrS family aminotransferase [Armatimonadota bacterium]
MRVPFYDIKAQYDELKAELDPAVMGVLSSGGYIMGPNHNAFEAEVAAMHGCKHGIAVNSGTDALRILLDAAGIGAGDEVITTAFTFVATAEVIVQTGARPVFVDIDPNHYQIDPAKVEAAITPRTKAIMPIHLFGQLVDVKALEAIAAKHGLKVIEDAAQAIGAHHEGTYCGNFGIGAGFSFYVTKNLGAIGDGGLILTNDDAIMADCKSYRIHGMGRERYYYDHVGYTSRLSEIQAAALRVKLKAVPRWNARRAELAKVYFEELIGTGIGLPQTLPGNNNTWHQFSIRAKDRDALQAFLKEQGVDSMIYYPVPLHFHEPYRHLASGEGSLPVTEQLCREILSLPIHQHLSEEQVLWAAQKVKEFAVSAVR